MIPEKSVIILQRVVPFLTGTDFDDILYAIDEDLAVTDMTGIEYLLRGFDDTSDRNLGDDNLDLYLGQQVRFDHDAAVILGLTLLDSAAEYV